MGKVIGIIGSRRRNSATDFLKIMEALNEVFKAGDEIVSGGCPEGGDRFAEIIAKEQKIPIKIYYPDWARKGKSAGFQRNTLIAQEAEILIAAVAEDRKGGTEDTIRKYQKLGKTDLILV